ncbi:MAG: hypothetical protein MdMp014T_1859 [Treponematales bacterium]
MKVLKRMCVMCALLAVTAAGAFGFEVGGSAPKFTNESDASNTVLHEAIQGVVDNLNDLLDDGHGKGYFNDLLDSINGQIDGIDTKPEKFIGAWANSSVYASSYATQRGYQGYKLIAVTVGPMIGVQLPGSPFDLENTLANVQTTLNDDHDLALGLGIQALSGQASLKVGTLLPFLPFVKGLSVGVKFGMVNKGLLPADIVPGDFGFESTSFGIVANYQIFKERSLLGILKWRGLSVGSGLIWSSTRITASQSLGLGGEQSLGDYGSFSYDPSITFNMTTDTYTIPLEVSTAIRLLFVNVHAGIGADVAFGSNNMTIGVESPLDLQVEGTTAGVNVSDYIGTTAGSLSVSAGGTVEPAFLQPKLMAGLGFVLGPVILDIPVTYYFGETTGLNVGVTLGVTF